MVKFLLTALLLVSNPLVFFSKRIENWSVTGFLSKEKHSTFCALQLEMDKSSSFTLISDLVDGELYSIIKNVEWDSSIKSPINLFFTKNNENKQGNVPFEPLDKNTVAIRNIDAKKFLKDFTEFNILKITLNNKSLEIPLNVSYNTVESFIGCIQAHNKIKSGKVFDI